MAILLSPIFWQFGLRDSLHSYFPKVLSPVQSKETQYMFLRSGTIVVSEKKNTFVLVILQYNTFFNN